MRALMISIVAGAGIALVLLTLAVVVNKAVREIGESLDRRRREVLIPAVYLYASEAGRGSILGYLPRRLSRRDRRVTEGILFEAAHLVKGGTRERITAAFEALGSVAAAIRGLSSPRWWRRAEAAESLGAMRSAGAVDPLVALMEDPVGEVRIRAAAALGSIRGSTSIRPLVAALGDPSRWSAIRVAEILIGVGAEAVAELLAAFDRLPHQARLSALDVLGRIRSHEALPLMTRGLQDVHPDIRARAAHGLGLIGDPSSTDDLLAALGDAEWPVRAMAAKALGRLGEARAIPALSAALSDRQWWVRANAGEALRGLGAPGREALVRMLDADDVYARHQAIEQLEQGRILDAYIADLASPDLALREAALKFVEKVIRLQRIGRLTQQSLENTQDGIRRALAEVLRRVPQEETS